MPSFKQIEYRCPCKQPDCGTQSAVFGARSAVLPLPYPHSATAPQPPGPRQHPALALTPLTCAIIIYYREIQFNVVVSYEYVSMKNCAISGHIVDLFDIWIRNRFFKCSYFELIVIRLFLVRYNYVNSICGLKFRCFILFGCFVRLFLVKSVVIVRL